MSPQSRRPPWLPVNEHVVFHPCEHDESQPNVEGQREESIVWASTCDGGPFRSYSLFLRRTVPYMLHPLVPKFDAIAKVQTSHRSCTIVDPWTDFGHIRFLNPSTTGNGATLVTRHWGRPRSLGSFRLKSKQTLGKRREVERTGRQARVALPGNTLHLTNDSNAVLGRDVLKLGR